LLSFREFPAILNAFRKLIDKTDVFIIDGQGIAHPRRMGLASHIGVVLDIVTIGCAKTNYMDFLRNQKIKNLLILIYMMKIIYQLGSSLEQEKMLSLYIFHLEIK